MAPRPHGPVPVRNDVHRGDDEEFMVLRHYRLQKGRHRAFYELSRPAMWEVYQKIGTRIMGDWQVVYPAGAGASPHYDESYRLARYASLEHWQDTRNPPGLMGTGPFTDLAAGSGASRNQLVLRSDGAFYLRGRMAPDVPYHLPALGESYEVTAGDPGAAAGPRRPVRYERPLPGHEVVVLQLLQLQKGGFGEFHAHQGRLLPFLSKIGVRALGEWLVVHPPSVSDSLPEALPDCDQALSLVRYASYQHWQAAQDLAALGGDGPDFQEADAASKARAALTKKVSTTFLSGYLYDNPAQFAPVIQEKYRAKL